MLTASQFDAVLVPLTELFEEYNISVIRDIARRLSKMDMPPAAAWQVTRLNQSGMLYERILAELSKLTGKSEAALRQAFEAAGVKSTRFDDKIYKAAGMDPPPLNLSPAMTQALTAGLQKTAGAVRNLTMTTVNQAYAAFVEAADVAYLQVSTGAMSYDQAIRAAIKNVAGQGLSVVNYGSGRSDQLDVAMRRTVLTGVTQTTGVMQFNRAQELGQDLVQTSAHAGARPSHREWQGKIFSLSGMDPDYPPFAESTGYGTPGGLCGVNCRHSYYPFFRGISKNAYTEAAKGEVDDKTVEINGREISMYEATQKQRAIERAIRKAKREAEALDAAALDNAPEIQRVRELQARMREFLRQTGLDRQRVREQVL